MHIIFYPLMLCSWNFADCYFPVLCSHSTRKLQIWRHYRKKYSKSKKKSMLQKIFVLSNILSFYSLVLWKNVCYCSRKLLLWPNILPEIIYSNKVLVKTRWSSTVWKSTGKSTFGRLLQIYWKTYVTRSSIPKSKFDFSSEKRI